MLWSPFQPPERYRPHYFFILACISTSSFFSTRASRPSVLSPTRPALDISIFRLFLYFLPRSTDVHTAALRPMCLSHIFLPETIGGNYTLFDYVTNPVLLARNHRRQRKSDMCLLYYCCLFLKHSTEGTHTHKLRDEGRFLFNPPNVRPVFSIFLYDLPHFRSPTQ